MIVRYYAHTSCRIRLNKPAHRAPSPEGSITSDHSASSSSARAITLCRSAANHITKIVCSYGEHFSLDRGPAFLSYYVFSASIMHVTLCEFSLYSLLAMF
jgi:hypothetical protein